MAKIAKYLFAWLCTPGILSVCLWAGCADQPPQTTSPPVHEQKGIELPTDQAEPPATRPRNVAQPDASQIPIAESSGVNVVREASENQAPGLMINNGQLAISPLTVKVGQKEIFVEGQQGGLVTLWEFKMIGGEGPQETVPDLPPYITEKISWKEIDSKSSPNFTLDYFNRLMRYLACRYPQAEAEEELLKHVRNWPFVASADWQTSQFSDKRFLRVVSKAGDIHDYFTNWGNPENLKDPVWRDFTKPKVWGPPNFKDGCDAVHGKGKTVEEALGKRLKGELEFLDEFMKHGGIYVRTYDPYYPTWWLRGNQQRKDTYQKINQILSDTQDKPTRAERVYDVRSPGYPEIPRNEQELKAINELIRFFDTDPKVRGWFAQRAEGK